jgi:hypothetical protein
VSSEHRLALKPVLCSLLPNTHIEQRTGILQPTLRRAEAHVAAVEKYPELTPMPQSDAITISKNLDKLPEPQ